MKTFIGVLLTLALSFTAIAKIERFFIGKVEETQEDYCAVDSSLVWECEVWIYEDTTINVITSVINAASTLPMVLLLRHAKNSNGFSPSPYGTPTEPSSAR